jgi:hypothetical protein
MMSARPQSDPLAAPITISAKNCEQLVGMSWPWVRRFAAANGVPCWRVGNRKHLIPVAPLMAALARASATATPARELSDVERLAALRAKLGYELRPVNEFNEGTTDPRIK